jgi:hypothetical protein
MFTILNNGRRFRGNNGSFDDFTFETIQEAIEAVRGLEAKLNRLLEHSPYTIMRLRYGN